MALYRRHPTPHQEIGARLEQPKRLRFRHLKTGRVDMGARLGRLRRVRAALAAGEGSRKYLARRDRGTGTADALQRRAGVAWDRTGGVAGNPQ